jgi:hypothetical protein
MARYKAMQAEHHTLQQQITQLSRHANRVREFQLMKQELWETKNTLSTRETELRVVRHRRECAASHARQHVLLDHPLHRKGT